jgi:hypothetical protein
VAPGHEAAQPRRLHPPSSHTLARPVAQRFRGRTATRTSMPAWRRALVHILGSGPDSESTGYELIEWDPFLSGLFSYHIQTRTNSIVKMHSTLRSRLHYFKTCSSVDCTTSSAGSLISFDIDASLIYSTGQRAPACFYISCMAYLAGAGNPSYARAPPQPQGAPPHRHQRARQIHSVRTGITKNRVFSLLSRLTGAKPGRGTDGYGKRNRQFSRLPRRETHAWWPD